MMMKQIKPFRKENNIPVVFTSSAFYAPYMGVTIQSLIDFSSTSHNYDILILNKDISEEDKAKCFSLIYGRNNFSIRFIEVNQALDMHNFNFREGYSSESFYRVIMVALLTEYDKVVYLDSDLIIRADIADLYTKEDMENNLVAAAIDIDGLASCFSDHDGRKEYMVSYLGVKDLHNYLQSGVMIFRLSEWRKSFTLDQIIDQACAPEIMFGDQDVLNKLCNDRIHFIDMSWNTIIDHRKKQIEELLVLAPIDLLDDYFQARKNPKIIHYGGTKPWEVPDCDMCWCFWESARKTPFYEDIIRRNVGDFRRADYGD